MTMNGVIALILLYFIEFDSLVGLLRYSGWPILSAEYRLPLLAKTELQRGFSAIAELLVESNYYNNVVKLCMLH